MMNLVTDNSTQSVMMNICMLMKLTRIIAVIFTKKLLHDCNDTFV